VTSFNLLSAVNSCFSFLRPYAQPTTTPKADFSRLTIRMARSRDLDRLSEVLAESFHPRQKTNRWVYSLLKFGIYEDLKTRLRSHTSRYACLVAVVPVATLQGESSEVVGTVELTLRSTSWYFGAPQYPYISNLAVSPEYRRQGIAKQLLRQCETTATRWGFRKLYLHVLDNNQSARSLYENDGYTVQRIETSYRSWLLQHPRKMLLSKSMHPSRKDGLNINLCR
jgi:ribosomal protein S18 acetylase RimI-like enzyme